jgi:alpha/beta superfamily hydrolase
MDRIRFATNDGITLEGELHRPDGDVRARAVICHPHPQHGGSKDHPVLWAIRIDLTRRGLVVLTFNFRGVMGSEGEYGGGEAETSDVRAAIDRVHEEAAGPLFVCGWSFGANVALRTALMDDRIQALALVGFPLGETSVRLPPVPDPDQLAAYDRPVLFVAGDADEYCPVPALRQLAGAFPDATVEIVPGTGHYFSKREREAAALIGGFAERALPVVR